MFNVFFFFFLSGIEIPFTGGGKKKVFVTACSNMTEQHAIAREFAKNAPSAMKICTWHKIFKEEGCLCRAKGSVTGVVHIKVSKVGDLKAPFSIATTSRCREWSYSFPWIAPLYP